MEKNAIHLENIPLSELTTIGIGGLAKRVSYPMQTQTLIEEVEACQKRGEPFFLLGNGSNVLASDHGFQGTVFVVKHLRDVVRQGESLTVGAGVSVGQLMRFCLEHSLSGWEFMAGIPATIGGLTAMNAGACGFVMSDIVHCVTIIERGVPTEIPLERCGFGQKTSRFLKNGEVILSVKLDLHTAERETIEGNLKRCMQRRSHLPKGKSMGCVFQNTAGRSAGSLISCLGLCGFRIGDALIAHTHGNFILNVAHAAERDVCALIDVMKNTVLREFGIELKEEIRYLR